MSSIKLYWLTAPFIYTRSVLPPTAAKLDSYGGDIGPKEPEPPLPSPPREKPCQSLFSPPLRLKWDHGTSVTGGLSHKVDTSFPVFLLPEQTASKSDTNQMKKLKYDLRKAIQILTNPEICAFASSFLPPQPPTEHVGHTVSIYVSHGGFINVTCAGGFTQVQQTVFTKVSPTKRMGSHSAKL